MRGLRNFIVRPLRIAPIISPAMNPMMFLTIGCIFFEIIGDYEMKVIKLKVNGKITSYEIHYYIIRPYPYGL